MSKKPAAHQTPITNPDHLDRPSDERDLILAAKRDYDSEFCPEGYNFDKGTEEGGVRISVLHPRYLLYMANIMVRMEDGLLNIDDKIKGDFFQCPQMTSEKLIAFLNAVLIPAIKLRVDAGKNPVSFRHASADNPART